MHKTSLNIHTTHKIKSHTQGNDRFLQGGRKVDKEEEEEGIKSAHHT